MSGICRLCMKDGRAATCVPAAVCVEYALLGLDSLMGFLWTRGVDELRERHGLK